MCCYQIKHCDLALFDPNDARLGQDLVGFEATIRAPCGDFSHLGGSNGRCTYYVALSVQEVDDDGGELLLETREEALSSGHAIRG
jgi:hypothetical protein